MIRSGRGKARESSFGVVAVVKNLSKGERRAHTWVEVVQER